MGPLCTISEICALMLVENLTLLYHSYINVIECAI